MHWAVQNGGAGAVAGGAAGHCAKLPVITQGY
jgi:hypothetical protein